MTDLALTILRSYSWLALLGSWVVCGLIGDQLGLPGVGVFLGIVSGAVQWALITVLCETYEGARAK